MPFSNKTVERARSKHAACSARAFALSALMAVLPQAARAGEGAAARSATVRVVTVSYALVGEDRSDHPWAGVHLKLSRAGAAHVDTATTDERGRAVFARVRPGLYTIFAQGVAQQAEGGFKAVEEKSRKPFRVLRGHTVAETLRIVGIPDPKGSLYKREAFK